MPTRAKKRDEGAFKAATIAQLGFIAIAAIAVYGFMRAAQNDQRRASCTALCSLAPAYAGRDRIAPDFELPDMNGVPVRLSSFISGSSKSGAMRSRPA